MGISLTLFLNLNCLMLILFPYGKMFAQKGVNKAESFSKSVCSTAFYNKPKIWTKNSKNSEFAVL